MIDLEGYAVDSHLDAQNHEIEVLHDPTHVRSYLAVEWKSFFEEAGLTVEVLKTNFSEQPGGVSIRRWCEIASSGTEAEHQIRDKLSHMSKQDREALGFLQSADEFYYPVRTVLVIGCKHISRKEV